MAAAQIPRSCEGAENEKILLGCRGFDPKPKNQKNFEILRGNL